MTGKDWLNFWTALAIVLFSTEHWIGGVCALILAITHYIHIRNPE